MADYTQLMNLEKKKQEQHSPTQTPPYSSSQPTNRSTNQSTNQSTSRLTSQSISQQAVSRNKVLEKPKAFYITEQLNKHIDEAVRYYQEKHNLKKVDRSIVVTALLDNEANWTEEALDLLFDRILNQLTSRLTNR